MWPSFILFLPYILPSFPLFFFFYHSFISLSLPTFLSLALYRAFVLKAVVVLGLTVHCSVSHSLCNSDSVKGWMTGSLWKEERKGNPPPSTANDWSLSSGDDSPCFTLTLSLLPLSSLPSSFPSVIPPVSFHPFFILFWLFLFRSFSQFCDKGFGIRDKKESAMRGGDQGRRQQQLQRMKRENAKQRMKRERKEDAVRSIYDLLLIPLSLSPSLVGWIKGKQSEREERERTRVQKKKGQDSIWKRGRERE